MHLYTSSPSAFTTILSRKIYTFGGDLGEKEAGITSHLTLVTPRSFLSLPSLLDVSFLLLDFP